MKICMLFIPCFFTRDSIYAIACTVYATPIPSVCPSDTRVICIKTGECIIEIFFTIDRPIILVFRHQGSLQKSGASPPTGAPNTWGVAIFDQYAAIYRKRDIAAQTYLRWKTNIKSYVLYRIVPLSMTLSDPEPHFQGHLTVYRRISRKRCIKSTPYLVFTAQCTLVHAYARSWDRMSSVCPSVCDVGGL